jgi:hypothetical protein
VRRALAAVALAIAALVTGAAPLPAGAATTHRAAVIVDTGSEVHRVIVTFTEDSISGLEALDRAGANPVVWNYAGQGGAVCRLYGVGRDAGPTCLGGQGGDARYWAYFRAAAGTSEYKYSPVCACTARVHDGDVEGWRFGTGQRPPFASVQDLTGPPPTQATTPATAPPTGGGDAVTPSTSRGTAATSTTTAAPGATTSSTATTSTTAPPVDVETKQTASRRPEKQAAAASSGSGGSGGGAAGSLIGFGLVLAALGGGIVWARRRRRAATP